MTDLQEQHSVDYLSVVLRRMEERKPEPDCTFGAIPLAGGIFMPNTGKLHPYKCFCKIKKYGKSVFDPALMPLYWQGCANCKNEEEGEL